MKYFFENKSERCFLLKKKRKERERAKITVLQYNTTVYFFQTFPF